MLHDVFVPWEHVFVYRDIGLVNAQLFETGGRLLGNFQALVRFVVERQFAAGSPKAWRSSTTWPTCRRCRRSLAEDIAAFVCTLEAILAVAESAPSIRKVLMRAVKELPGGTIKAVPSSEKSFTSDETAGGCGRKGFTLQPSTSWKPGVFRSFNREECDRLEKACFSEYGLAAA